MIMKFRFLIVQLWLAKYFRFRFFFYISVKRLFILIFNIKSEFFKVWYFNPDPSEPNKRTLFPFQLCSVKSLFPLLSKPQIQKFLFFKYFSVVFIFETSNMTDSSRNDPASTGDFKGAVFHPDALGLAMMQDLKIETRVSKHQKLKLGHWRQK